MKIKEKQSIVILYSSHHLNYFGSNAIIFLCKWIGMLFRMKNRFESCLLFLAWNNILTEWTIQEGKLETFFMKGKNRKFIGNIHRWMLNCLSYQRLFVLYLVSLWIEVISVKMFMPHASLSYWQRAGMKQTKNESVHVVGYMIDFDLDAHSNFLFIYKIRKQYDSISTRFFHCRRCCWYCKCKQLPWWMFVVFSHIELFSFFSSPCN